MLSQCKFFVYLFLTNGLTNKKLGIMKTLFITLALVSSALLLAQEKEVIKTNNTQKITTFHDNGTIEQQGHQLKGKNHGVWRSYDKQGNAVAVGEYENGKKTGTWLFWVDGQIAEVNYQENRIQSVSYWESLGQATAGK